MRKVSQRSTPTDGRKHDDFWDRAVRCALKMRAIFEKIFAANRADFDEFLQRFSAHRTRMAYKSCSRASALLCEDPGTLKHCFCVNGEVGGSLKGHRLAVNV